MARRAALASRLHIWGPTPNIAQRARSWAFDWSAGRRGKMQMRGEYFGPEATVDRMATAWGAPVGLFCPDVVGLLESFEGFYHRGEACTGDSWVQKGVTVRQVI